MVEETPGEGMAGAVPSPTLRQVAGMWRGRRLRIADLPSSVVIPIWIVGGFVVLTAAILAAFAFSIDLPGPTLVVPSLIEGQPDQVEFLIVLYLWLALAAVSASALALVARPDSRRQRLVCVLVGLVMFTFLADLVSVGDTLHRYESLGLVEGSIASWRLFHAAGWIGVAAALVIAFAPTSLLRAGPLVPILLGAAPYALGLFAFLVSGETSYQLPGGVLGTAQALSVRPFLDNGQILSLAIIVLIFWQAATWARASSRDLGLRVTALVDRWPAVLWLLLGAKILFLGVGYLSAGPCRTGLTDVWTGSRCEDPAGWLVAGLFAVAVCAWLWRPARLALSAQKLTTVAGAIVAGFAMVTIGLVALRPVTALAGLFQIGPLDDPGAFPSCLAGIVGLNSSVLCATRALEGAIAVAPLATVVIAAMLGVALSVRPDKRAFGIPLLVFALWAAPRAFEAFASLVLGVRSAEIPSPGFELATFDAVLTLGILATALVGLVRRSLAAEAPTLTLVLVVSTLVAHGDTLVPGDWRPILTVLLLASPLVYVFFLDAGRLNEPAPDRPTRVLAAVVAAAAVLMLAAAGVLLGTRVPGGDVYGRLASLLFIVPFAAIVVGALITDLRTATPRTVEA